MNPSVGRIVHYTLSLEDAAKINRRRVAKPHEPGWPSGAQAHTGNDVQGGTVVAAVVTASWGETSINGQALLDGNDSLWIASRSLDPKQAIECGHGTPGTWHWPERVE